ncbi:glycoside hydrolase family 3 protein, partial [Mannheimia haemolytica]
GPFGSAVCGPGFLKSLTERQKLAQLLTVGVTGTADALDVVKSEGIGGIFIGSWTDESMLANGEAAQVAEASAVPLMVTID